jgi:glycosyltransferase involved in cell wall biosynthesis
VDVSARGAAEDVARGASPLTIGIDATPWVNRRGFGRFTREIVGALLRRDQTNRYVLFADAETAAAADLPGAAERVVVATRRTQAQASSADGWRPLADIVRMSFAVRRRPLDLFFVPSHLTYFPILGSVPAVVGIHDATAALHPDLIFSSSRARLFWTIKERLALAQAARVVTVSESARREIAAALRYPADRIAVLPEAPAPHFAPRTIGPAESARVRALGIEPDDGFVLHVGGISPHKNLERLVAAFARIARDPRHARLRLVLAGDVDRDPFTSSAGDVRAAIARAELEARVVFTGFVDDDLLALLYGAASVLAFPSLAEGFGLPAAEAKAAGTPVIASRAGSLPEVLGDAGILFDPTDEAAIESALRAVLEDPALRTRLRAAGIARARLFSWDRAAEILQGVLEEVARR